MKSLLYLIPCIVFFTFGYMAGTAYAGAHNYRQNIGQPKTVAVSKPDTLCEWMHISMRPKGFVIAQKALSVRVNGICVQHLDGRGKPFPVHYRVGWCEGKERVFNKIVELLNEKQHAR